MPRQEEASEMHLGGENVRVSQLIGVALAETANLIRETYHRVEVHVCVNKI